MTHQRFAEDIDRPHRGFTEVSQRFLNALQRSHFRLTIDSQETRRGLAEDFWTLASWRPPELWLCGHMPLAICSLVSCLLRVVGLWAASCWSWVSVWLVFGWLSLSRRSLDRRSSGRIGCAGHVFIHRHLQVTAMTVNWYVFKRRINIFL